MTVDILGLLIFLIIGAIAGLVAGTLMRGGGFGLLWNTIIGIIGAFIGAFFFDLLGISFSIVSPFITSLITATIGAIILLFIVGLIKR